MGKFQNGAEISTCKITNTIGTVQNHIPEIKILIRQPSLQRSSKYNKTRDEVSVNHHLEYI